MSSGTKSVTDRLLQSSTQSQASIMSRIEPSSTTITHAPIVRDNGFSKMQTTFTVHGPMTALTTASSTPLGGPNLSSFLSPSTEEILKRVTARGASLGAGSPGWEAAREQVLKNMRTSDSISASQHSMPAIAGRGPGKSRGAAESSKANTPNRASSTPSATAVTASAQVTPSRGRGRGGGRLRGRGRGTVRTSKRKRDEDEDSSNDHDASEDSDVYTPAQMTRSGRNVAKPTAYVPTIASPTQGSIKRRKVSIRAPSARSVCKTCQRGHSATANMIVFCDTCNTGYHQFCHHPPIEKDVIVVEDMPWHCVNCSHVNNQGRASGSPGSEPSRAPSQAQLEINLEALVSGAGWRDQEKKTYFESLSRQALVELLLKATTIDRALPVFPSSVAPREIAPKHILPNGINHDRPENTTNGVEPEEVVDDDPPTHFPRPGFGLARHLPPESEHLAWLVDENTSAFSHSFPAKEAEMAETARAAKT